MRGFTLIETIIYIALLGLLMTGTLLGSYTLIQSTGRTSASTAAQDEGSFVKRKIEWALAGMATPPTVSGSGCSGTLSVNRPGTPGPIQFQRSGNTIEMRESSSGPYIPLTTGNVSATCFNVTVIPATGTGPSGVSVTTTLSPVSDNGTPRNYDFGVTRYLRQ